MTTENPLPLVMYFLEIRGATKVASDATTTTTVDILLDICLDNPRSHKSLRNPPLKKSKAKSESNLLLLQQQQQQQQQKSSSSRNNKNFNYNRWEGGSQPPPQQLQQSSIKSETDLFKMRSKVSRSNTSDNKNFNWDRWEGGKNPTEVQRRYSDQMESSKKTSFPSTSLLSSGRNSPSFVGDSLLMQDAATCDVPKHCRWESKTPSFQQQQQQQQQKPGMIKLDKAPLAPRTTYSPRKSSNNKTLSTACLNARLAASAPPPRLFDNNNRYMYPSNDSTRTTTTTLSYEDNIERIISRALLQISISTDQNDDDDVFLDEEDQDEDDDC